MDATNALRQTGGSDDDRPRGACGGLLLLLAALAACAQGSAPPTSTSATPTPVCGNGVVEAREECDDGNAHNGDSCLTTCQAPASWVAGDVHAHSTGCGRYTSPDRLAALLKAQGLQVAAALVWGEGYFEDAPLFTGRDHPASGPDFILHYDMEVSRFPAARTGHLILLGLDSLRFSDDVFDSPSTGVPVVEWARRQPRAVVGMAHGQYWPADGSFPVPPGGCCVPWEVVVNAARGRLDFLTMEVVAVGDGPVDAGAMRLWTALQNTGFRVAIAGGSDWGCLTHVLGDDTPRTDVIVDGPVTYDGWLRGIKAGRTAAASGAGRRLNLRVEGRRLGEEVLLPAPQDVTVTLETQGPAAEEVEVRPRPIRVAGRERRHDEPRPRLPAQCIRPAHDREARPQGVSLVPERLALAVLPVLADRRLRGRAERRRAVEQVRSLAEPQQESIGPRAREPCVLEDQALADEPEPRLCRPSVVQGHRQERLREVVGQAERQHDDVRTVAQALALQHEQLLPRAVPLHRQVGRLDSVVASIQGVRERLVVRHTEAEGHGVPEDDHPGPFPAARRRQHGHAGDAQQDVLERSRFEGRSADGVTRPPARLACSSNSLQCTAVPDTPPGTRLCAILRSHRLE
jgi:cysteine-rich repeat protein